MNEDDTVSFAEHACWCRALLQSLEHHGFTIGDFDISADGREMVFDRAREDADIVLIELAEPS